MCIDYAIRRGSMGTAYLPRGFTFCSLIYTGKCTCVQLNILSTYGATQDRCETARCNANTNKMICRTAGTRWSKHVIKPNTIIAYPVDFTDCDTGLPLVCVTIVLLCIIYHYHYHDRGPCRVMIPEALWTTWDRWRWQWYFFKAGISWE
jgi:hypothetical protein